MISVYILFCVVYTLVVLKMSITWSKAIEESVNGGSNVEVSIVVPFRNERNHLPQLIKCLNEQTANKTTYEILFVDDHSEDDGASKINMDIPYRVLNLESKAGKKEAIKLGVSQAKHNWIITLDADVVVGQNWLASVLSAIQKHNSDLFILPMAISEGQNLFQNLQSLEFMSVVGVTAATALNAHPILCNGGNLAFKKEAYLNTLAERHDEHISSGDDVFFMHALKDKHQVKWLHSKEAIAFTSPCQTISEFIAQRIRWASKSNQFKDKRTILFGTLVLLTNLSIILFFIQALILSKFWLPFLIVFSLKFTADFLLLMQVAEWMSKTRLLKHSILLSLIYPFYILLITLGSIFFTPKWKGRRISLSPSNVKAE